MRIETRLSAKKSKRMCLIGTRSELGQSLKGGHSALWKCWLALQKCRLVLLDTKCIFVFGCVLDSLFRFLEPSLALRHVFNLYSKIFIYFLDNSSLFSKTYLVDKFSKINLDKIQIIYNFIVIQLSLLFLCKQSYFKH